VPTSCFDPGSFRDRTSRVLLHDGGVFRVLSADALAAWEQVRAQPFYQRFASDGLIVGTTRLPETEEPPVPDRAHWAAVLRHERIPFVSYPYEWCFGMLRDAARLQLDLLAAALDEDVGM
jgi:hypothetical protein